jgi:hypothetical protein
MEPLVLVFARVCHKTREVFNIVRRRRVLLLLAIPWVEMDFEPGLLLCD